MRFILQFFCVCALNFGYSQTNSFRITGEILTTVDKKPLESATVYLQQVKDSTLITYTITNAKGKFILEGQTNKESANLFISHIGFQSFQKKINLSAKKIELGIIPLQVSSNTLSEVIIHSQAPITIKKDTLEFNVKSFKTKKDANVEDLLKELPGVEVDEAGKIKINGKGVNKVLVNGKPFFGDDPTIATRNLNKDIIKKIQITDTKTDTQAFTGEEGDGKNKTVNLVIDKDKNKGVFGRLAASGGTDERYEFAGLFNKFDNDLQLSFLGGGNNINSPGFSFGEIEKMFGNSYNIQRQLNRWDDGIITSQNYGVNYADDLGEKVEVTANYFVGDTELTNNVISNKENILPESRFFTNYTADDFTKSVKHSTETVVKIKPDSTLLLTIIPKFRFTKDQVFNSSNEFSTDENDELINESNSISRQENDINYFENSLNISKRFGSAGSFFKLNFFNRINTTENENFLNNEILIFGDTPSETSINQFRTASNSNNTNAISLTYRIPIYGKEFLLDLKYGYRNNSIENERNTFDFNEETQQFNSLINEDLSSDFIYTNNASTPGINMVFKKKKFSTNLNINYVFRNLESNDFLRPQFNLERNFTAPTVAYKINYNGAKSYFNLRYNLENEAPSLRELQPFTDVTNPLNIITGNPNLKPSNTHRISTNYSINNFQKGNSFNVYLQASLPRNDVVQKQAVNEELIRETTFTNVNGGRNLFGFTRYGMKVKIDSLKTLHLSSGASLGFNKSINFNNETRFTNSNTSISPSIEVRFSWKKITNLKLGYYPRYTKSTFDVEEFNNQEFVMHNFNFKTTNFFGKHLEWENNFNYNYNPNVGDEFQKSILLWNSTLSYSILKNKVDINLKAYDILDQNNKIQRFAFGNLIEDRQTTVLQRYVMFGVSWKFNTLGKAGEVRESRFRIF